MQSCPICGEYKFFDIEENIGGDIIWVCKKCNSRFIEDFTELTPGLFVQSYKLTK